ncbi:hypothetical protein [Saccharothrix syringae]|uniref:Uncharacterized protein n=1 Tax=Saccharothrix syringae TaxID=103733 RepID=A0A5Q0H8S8_SACSY|nr:hypothetical protein [Saccharothrix syringae]QFZ22325.1 hypothetical protein EKG83_37300 [Saccharothrix syringae]
MSRRLLGAVLLVLAAAAAVVGTFLPLIVLTGAFDPGGNGGGLRIVTTAWESRVEPGPSPLSALAFDHTAQYGVPIVVSAALLVVAAALVLLPEEHSLVARYTALGATGVLFGAVWAVWTAVSAAVRAPEGAVGEYLRETSGGGVWLLSAAVLVAVAGVVLVHARRPAPVGGAVVYAVGGDDVHPVGGDDEDTPPLGIPVVEVARLPESDYPGPGAPEGSRSAE